MKAGIAAAAAAALALFAPATAMAVQSEDGTVTSVANGEEAAIVYHLFLPDGASAERPGAGRHADPRLGRHRRDRHRRRERLHQGRLRRPDLGPARLRQLRRQGPHRLAAVRGPGRHAADRPAGRRPARGAGGRRRPADRHERRLVRRRDPVRDRRARQARRRDRARDLLEQPVEHARAARRDQARSGRCCSTRPAPRRPTASSDGYDFALHRALAESSANGAWSKATHEFFEARGPWNLLEDIEAPTFIIQATTDTLFPPSQAADNWRGAAEVPQRARSRWRGTAAATASATRSRPGPRATSTARSSSGSTAT